MNKEMLIDDARNIMIKSSKLDANLVENSSVILGFFQKDAEDIVNHVFDALKRTDSKLIVKTDTKWITKALPDLPDKAKPMLVNSKRIMSERVLVLVDTLDGSTAEAFAKYNHYPNSNKWHIEGYQGEWNVLGWHCLPTV